MVTLSRHEAEALAGLHARSFTTPRPWSAEEFALIATSPHHLLLTEPGLGLAVIQVVVDEAELLTIAVEPQLRRQGAGARLLGRALDEAAARGAVRMFLDVAADNLAAIALYHRAGFSQIGRRRNYYRHADHMVDALLMERALSAQ